VTPDRDALARIIRAAIDGWPVADPTVTVTDTITDAVLAHLATTHPPTDTGLRAEWESRLADLLAKRRTHGQVFMGGEHHPMPSEVKDAREFIGALLAALAAPHPGPDQADGGRWAVSDAANRLLTALADCVRQATDYGEQDGGFVAFYLLPTGPIHRAIPLLQEYGMTVRPHTAPDPGPDQADDCHCDRTEAALVVCPVHPERMEAWLAAIEARRADPEFMASIQASIARHKPILDRLAEDDGPAPDPGPDQADAQRGRLRACNCKGCAEQLAEMDAPARDRADGGTT